MTATAETHAPRLLVIGAHPDDCEFKAGGLAALYAAAGNAVKFVSVTNGESGHHRLRGEELVRIRRAEAQASAGVCGIEYDVLDFPDGGLLPTMDARLEIIRLIRRFAPDLVLTHRPNDYHPDHRYTAQLVCDAAYMVTVPPVAVDVPHLRSDPVFGYLSDDFQRPYPFSPDVAIDIEPVLDRVVDMLHCHKSQFYDWLAYNHGYEHDLPADDAGRREWLAEWFQRLVAPLADRCRSQLVERYGKDRGERVRYVETFEICEYGSELTPELCERLFGFV